MALRAISDLHLDRRLNYEAVAAMPSFGNDWLILAGDVAESLPDFERALDLLVPRFARLLWVPGNHELWSEPSGLGGVAKYHRLVTLCRERGVLTPEDPYPPYRSGGQDYRLAPLALLYDYSFRPADVPPARAVEWAAQTGVVAADEVYLAPQPYASISEWCEARCRAAEARLTEACRAGQRLVLINHWPLRHELAWLPRIPRFSPWCGTQRTEDWHRRFDAAVVIYGHLHIRGSYLRDGVRFEEVSLGYPKQWRRELGAAAYLREILPDGR